MFHPGAGVTDSTLLGANLDRQFSATLWNQSRIFLNSIGINAYTFILPKPPITTTKPNKQKTPKPKPTDKTNTLPCQNPQKNKTPQKPKASQPAWNCTSLLSTRNWALKGRWRTLGAPFPKLADRVTALHLFIASYSWGGGLVTISVSPVSGYNQELLQLVRVKKDTTLGCSTPCSENKAGWKTGTAGETPADLAGLWPPPSGHFNHGMSRRTSSYHMLWLKKLQLEELIWHHTCNL